MAVRLGPFPLAVKQLIVKDNHGKVNAVLFESGDSKWAWARLGAIAISCLVQARVK